jgi:hypothetical protein
MSFRHAHEATETSNTTNQLNGAGAHVTDGVGVIGSDQAGSAVLVKRLPLGAELEIVEGRLGRVLEPASIYRAFHDCDCSLGLHSTFSAVAAGTGSGVTVPSGSSVTALNRYAGLARLATGTSSTGHARIVSHSANGAAWVNVRLDDARRHIAIARAAPENLPDGTNDFTIAFGWRQINNYTSHGVELVCGAGFPLTNRWYLRTRRSGIETLVDTGVNVTTVNTFQRLRLEVPAAGSQALAYIDDVLVATSTSNVPTDQSTTYGVNLEIVKTLGTADRFLWCDWIGWQSEGAR